MRYDKHELLLPLSSSCAIDSGTACATNSFARSVQQMGKNYADMDDYVKRLDRDRVRLVTKLKVKGSYLDRGTHRMQKTITPAPS